MTSYERLGVRWTIGDVSERGWEALRLSIWGAYRLFGPEAAYAVCFNSLPLEAARERAGALPPGILWRDATNDLPPFLRQRVDQGMAEGVAWKLAPLQLFPDRYELSLDNDCILWDVPDAIGAWLGDDDPRACVLAEDVWALFGKYASLCGEEPRNSGIRGLPPGFDLEAAFREVLTRFDEPLTSELDEQGLQVAALLRHGRVRAVRVDEVTICSPFPPHLPRLGRRGAHFVGLNARHFDWQLDGRYAEEHIRDNWERLRPDLYERVGLPLSGAPKAAAA